MKSTKVVAQKLQTVYDPAHAQQAALWLLEKVTGKKAAFFFANPHFQLTSPEKARLDLYIEKLVNDNYPLQYILGTVSFGPLELLVEPPILIPRPETEEWIMNLIEQLKPFKKEKVTILDLCTGSGCLALLIAHEFPNFTLHAADINPKALALAAKNKKKIGIKNVTFFEGDLFEAVPNQRYDLIISNPPYVSDTEYQTLAPIVKKWEDKNALVAEQQGLDFYQRLSMLTPRFLKETGVLQNNLPQLIVEIGAGQQAPVETLFKNNAWKNTTTSKDASGKPRTVSAHFFYS